MKSFTLPIAVIIFASLVLSCQDKGKETPPAKEEVTECHVGINITLQAEIKYQTNQETPNCPPYTPADMANADLKALESFTAYGDTFCRNANGCPQNPEGCKPDISGLKNMGYRTESRAIGTNPVRYDCYLIATVNGTISCHCK